MRLRVTKKGEASTDSFSVSYCNLQNPSILLYINSTKWDAVYIEVDDDFPTPFIKHLKKDRPLEVEVVAFTDATVKTLCLLFPEKASSMRRAYINGEEPNWKE